MIQRYTDLRIALDNRPQSRQLPESQADTNRNIQSRGTLPEREGARVSQPWRFTLGRGKQSKSAHSAFLYPVRQVRRGITPSWVKDTDTDEALRIACRHID